MLISIPSLLTLSLICLTALSIPETISYTYSFILSVIFPETELVLIILPSNLFPLTIISAKFYF